jgi:hypothetical protein
LNAGQTNPETVDVSELELKEKNANETTIKPRREPRLSYSGRLLTLGRHRNQEDDLSGNQPPTSIHDLRPVADGSRCRVADGAVG